MLTLSQTIPTSGTTIPPVVIAGLVMGGVVLGLIVLIIATVNSGKKRRAALAQTFAAMNMNGSADPDNAAKALAYARVPSLHKIMRHGHKGVRWFAESPPASTTPGVFMIEHSYVVSTGKNSQSVYHTAACVAVPAQWGEVALSREGMFTKIGKLFGLKDLDLEDPAFNNAWRVRTADENFALALLSPEVQQFLAAENAPFKNDSWIIGSGTLSLVLGRQLKPEELDPFRARLLALIRMLAPELRSQII
jgi:Tfp pilus assembly protein PilV